MRDFYCEFAKKFNFFSQISLDEENFQKNNFPIEKLHFRASRFSNILKFLEFSIIPWAEFGWI